MGRACPRAVSIGEIVNLHLAAGQAIPSLVDAPTTFHTSLPEAEAGKTRANCRRPSTRVNRIEVPNHRRAVSSGFASCLPERASVSCDRPKSIPNHNHSSEPGSGSSQKGRH